MGRITELTVRRRRAVTKGHHGYLKFRKRELCLRALVLLAGVAGLTIIGVIVTDTTKNLMSLFAILTAVPMAMQLVSLIALSGFQGRPDAEFEEVSSLTGKGILDTELIVGRRDGKSLPVDYAFIHEEGIFVYTSEKDCDVKKTEEYLHSFLRLSQVDCGIRLYTELKPFLSRLGSLPPSDRNTCGDVLLEREGVLRAIAM